MKDVADAVGVHVSTVSRALDPKTSHRITPEVAENIRRACRQLGYRGNISLYASTRTGTVGVVVPDIADPFFGPMIRGIEHVLSAHNYLAALANVDGEGPRESDIADVLLARRVDGLLLVSGAWPDDVIGRLAGEGIPIVTLHRRANDPRVSTVVHDEEEGIRLVLEHLAALGHRTVAHVAGPQELASGANRYRAFDMHRKRLGLDASGKLISFANTYSEGEGERCTDALMREHGITAIACASDRFAIGGVAALQRMGLDCPRDVSVTGYNDMLFADRVVPSLTTVRTDQHRQGAEAAEILIEMMQHDPARRVPRHVVLPVGLRHPQLDMRHRRGGAFPLKAQGAPRQTGGWLTRPKRATRVPGA